VKNSLIYKALITSHARWLWRILLFEYIVAMTISPTILSRSPFLNSFVECFAFIPVVHGFDDTAKHPEAVRFYIVMTTLLLIPKVMSIYTTFAKSKVPFMLSYVITPYTKTKAADSGKLFRDTFFGVERENSEIEQVPRSMFSRIVCSLLFLVVGLVVAYIKSYGVSGYPPLQITSGHLTIGFDLWWEFSASNTEIALVLAICTFIIKDYIRLFISIGRRIILLFK